MGAIGGGIFSFMKGWRNSPKVSLLSLYFLWFLESFVAVQVVVVLCHKLSV